MVQAWGQCDIWQIITIFGQLSDKIWIRHRFGFYYYGKSLRNKQNDTSTRKYASSKNTELSFFHLFKVFQKAGIYRADFVGYRIFSFHIYENPSMWPSALQSSALAPLPRKQNVSPPFGLNGIWLTGSSVRRICLTWSTVRDIFTGSRSCCQWLCYYVIDVTWGLAVTGRSGPYNHDVTV